MTSRAPSRWAPASRAPGYSAYPQQPEQAIVMVPNPAHQEETKSNICCIVFTVIGCVAVAALGFWAIWYFGIRKQPDTTGQREEGKSTPERESPSQPGNGKGKKLAP